MKKILLATITATALFSINSVQAQMGDTGMRKDKASKSSHHRLRGSSVHETAANYHANAAKHHKLAAKMYRRNKDASAVEHAEAAIDWTNRAAKATAATKELLSK